MKKRKASKKSAFILGIIGIILMGYFFPVKVSWIYKTEDIKSVDLYFYGFDVEQEHIELSEEDAAIIINQLRDIVAVRRIIHKKYVNSGPQYIGCEIIITYNTDSNVRSRKFLAWTDRICRMNGYFQYTYFGAEPLLESINAIR